MYTTRYQSLLIKFHQYISTPCSSMILSINSVSDATKPGLTGQTLISVRVFHGKRGKAGAVLTSRTGSCLHCTKQVGFLTVQLMEGRIATYSILAVVSDMNILSHKRMSEKTEHHTLSKTSQVVVFSKFSDRGLLETSFIGNVASFGI